MVEIVGNGSEKTYPAETREQWNSISKCAFLLSRIITFDGWFDVMNPVITRQPFLAIFFFALVVTCTLGLMNLIVGVMVNSAFDIVREEKERQMNVKMKLVRECLVNAKSVFTRIN